MRTTRTLLIAALTLGAVAAPALGAPDRKGNLSQAIPFAWDGGPVTGAGLTSELSGVVPCDSTQGACDQTLLTTTEPGQLTVEIASADPNSQDLDLYLYASDAAGTQGNALKSSTGPDASEKLTYEAVKGYYLVVVVPATAAGGTFKGRASLGPLPPDPAPIDFGADPAPPASGGTGGTGDSPPTTGSTTDLAPSTRAFLPKGKRITTLSGTAADSDGKVAYVDVALVRVSGKTCRSMTAAQVFKKRSCKAPRFIRAKGRGTWHLPLKHALAKGTYVLYARATDDLGRVDSGFGAANRVTFKVS